MSGSGKSEQEQTEFCVILWCFKLSFSSWCTKWRPMKYSCYQDCSVIHGWFVKCAFCWQMHRLSKSLEIWFRMASFSKTSLLTCLCLRHKRVEKSQAILEHLMTFRSSISTGKPDSNYCLWCVFFFGFLKSSVWFLRRFLRLYMFTHEQWCNLR